MSQNLYRRVVAASSRPKPCEKRWSRNSSEYAQGYPGVADTDPSRRGGPNPRDAPGRAPLVAPVGTAPVPASPLAMPDPNPTRALPFYVEPQTPLEDLPCFTPGPLWACVGLDSQVLHRGHL